VSGRAAWGVWVSTLLAVALTLFLVSLNARSSSFWNTGPLILAFSSVGAPVASRRPENSIGWLFLSGAAVWIITSPGALPAGEWGRGSARRRRKKSSRKSCRNPLRNGPVTFAR
jgi:hypothetical protein